MNARKLRPVPIALLLCAASFPALAESTADTVATSAAGIGSQLLAIWNSLWSYYSDPGNLAALITLGVAAAAAAFFILVLTVRKRRLLAFLTAVVLFVAGTWGIPAIFGDHSTVDPLSAITLEQLEDPTDTDGDGLTDTMELIYGTDASNPDTDGDSLTDYQEVMAGTDPLHADADDDGLNDAEADPDSDGLTTAQELSLGTEPQMRDTDSDGLSDGDEVNLHKTDPLQADSDGDGASDGFEVTHGTDPLMPHEQFSIVHECDAADQVTPSVAITLKSEQADSLYIAPSDVIDSTDIPGSMGQAYDFSVEGSFNRATISFAFDPSVLPADGVPAIYYYNEETQLLEEQETFVSGGMASTVVTHFSTYVLLNKTAFDQVWDSDIKPPIALEDTSGLAEEMTLDIVFVIDCSLSMEDNDPRYLCKEVTREFVAKLRDGLDRAAIIRFARYAEDLCALSTDKAVITRALDKVDYSYGGYAPYSGTNGSAGLNAALNQLSSSQAKFKYVVFITDGEDNYFAYPYDTLISKAVLDGVNIYSIGMGSASESVLREVADLTGGKYYHATTALDAEDVINLDEVYEVIESETIDYSLDSNSDGISDYYTRLLCEGRLSFGTGKPNPFYLAGVTWEEIQQNKDFDGDEVLNGDELIISHDPLTGRVFTSYLSDPTLPDSDWDGLPDKTDPNPLTWNVCDRDLALCASAVYQEYVIGEHLDDLPPDKEKRVNNAFVGKSGLVMGDITEMKGWRVVNVLFTETLQMFAIRRDNEVIVAYRGTAPMSQILSVDWTADWLNNISTFVLGKSMYTPTCKEFMADVMAQNPGCRFHVTGHSLGGHLALNAAAKAMSLDRSAVGNVATFNGLGLCTNNSITDGMSRTINVLGRSLIIARNKGDAADAWQLRQSEDHIQYYYVDGDLVGSMLGAVTTHIGEPHKIDLHKETDDKHDMLNFVEYLPLDTRFQRYTK